MFVAEFYYVVYQSAIEISGGMGGQWAWPMDPSREGSLAADSGRQDPREPLPLAHVVTNHLSGHSTVLVWPLFRPESGSDDAGPHRTEDCPELRLTHRTRLCSFHHASTQTGQLSLMYSPAGQCPGQHHTDHSDGRLDQRLDRCCRYVYTPIPG